MRRYAFLGFMMLVHSCQAQEDLADFWRRGRVRELLVNGIPNVTLQQWAELGVNCVLGVKPEDAHALGLKTRTWFTMNMIIPRSFNNDLQLVQSMCAVNRDGSFLRPYDPLFPTVAENWSACVNNPGWREYSARVFRNMAQAGWDGCHIDYACHYEPCYCNYCQQAWRSYADERSLPGNDLLNLPGDLRHRMHEREFRIRCVMDFLGMVRDEARALRPGFCTDGTWHQDSGSTYQWAYGNHFDMMCIEGTTWDPFPPESQQILWLKLAHALSDHQVAMSVTYHLVTNGGERHHGRTARDRTEVALCEIMSQGAVSWLGLGGPNTGNLLREHADMVKAVYTTWTQLEPQLTTRRDVGQVGIVFSPRSYLVSGASRKQLYAIGQALMKSHVPFVIHSDVGLTVEMLAACPATVLLDAQALTPEATQALQQYVAQGGKLLMVGAEPKYDADWNELTEVPELLRKPGGEAGLATKQVNGRTVWYVLGDALRDAQLGASQYVTVNQTEPAPLAIEGESKALEVSGSPGPGYSLYLDITYQDGSNLWGQVATFPTGTHDWHFSRYVIQPTKPVRAAGVHVLLRGHSGTAWFRKVRFGPWDGEKITQDLLGDGKWAPYRDGFETEEIAGEGPTIKLATGADVVRVDAMHVPTPQSVAAVMKLLQPILAQSRMLTLEGEGAEQVYCDVAQVEGGWLLQLINYNAQLHPHLPELEQQQADRTIPVRNLRVTFVPSDGQAMSPATLKVPGREDELLPVQGNTFTIAQLDRYAAVIISR